MAETQTIAMVFLRKSMRKARAIAQEIFDFNGGEIRSMGDVEHFLQKLEETLNQEIFALLDKIIDKKLI